MRRTRIIWLSVVAVVAALAIPAATDGLPGYAGAKLCGACHKSTHAAIVSGYATTPHAGAFFAVGDASDTKKVVGDFSAAGGPKQADVAWVIGKGEREQSYLDAKFQALPQEWNVGHKMWMPGQSGDATKSCLGCHTTGYDPASGKWSEAGVACESCHGAGKAHAMSTKENKPSTIVRPKTLAPDRQAMICGRCHARGKAADGLPFAATFVPGEDLSAKFTLDAAYDQGARNSQYNDLVGGKHLAKGVTCDTCHEPHGVNVKGMHQLRKDEDETCTQCHAAAKLTGAQHSPAKDCTRCHMIKGSHQFEKPQVVAEGTAHWH